MQLLDRAILLLLLEKPMGKTELLDTIYETPPKHQRKKLFMRIDYQLMIMEKEGLIQRNKDKKYELAGLTYGYGVLQVAKPDATMETLEMGRTLIKTDAENNWTRVIFLEELPHE